MVTRGFSTGSQLMGAKKSRKTWPKLFPKWAIVQKPIMDAVISNGKMGTKACNQWISLCVLFY
jgi:hypothetical protein